MLAFGRAGAVAAPLASSAPSCGRLAEAPLVVEPGLEEFLIFEVTTARLAAGCPLLSPSRSRLDPAEASLRGPLAVAESEAEPLLGDSSFEPGFAPSRFRFVDEAAFS